MSDEFGLRGPKLPWACPNDRQLALRAKLQAGWSIKTNQFSQYPKPPPLTEREQQIIVSVVKKAEELDLHEQKRVGKLVDRLESLKKLANGNGVSECVLCGDTFGLYMFGRSNYKCHDCQKAVCRKCVVELSAIKAGISTAASSSGRDSIVRLCKVCSENRELIKKSGAWFYKGVPKFILPEKKNHYTNTYEKYAASPRYQEQKYVSRYINDDPESSTPSKPGDDPEPCCSTAGAASSAPPAPTPSTSSSNNSSKLGGYFWPRSLTLRSNQQLDLDESSSGEEAGIGGESSLLKSSAVAAAAAAGGAAASAATSRSLFGSRKGSTSSREISDAVQSSNGSGGNGSCLSRGDSPPVSRFFLSRNSPASCSFRSKSGSPVPPSAITTPNDLEPNNADGGILAAGMSEHSRASSSQNLSSRSGSFRKKSYEKVDFGKEPVWSKSTSGEDQPPHSPAFTTPPQIVTKTTNNGDNAKSSGSSSTDCLFQPSGSSLMSVTTAASIYNSTTSISATSSNASHAASSTTSQTIGPSAAPLGIIQIAVLYDDSHQALHCSVLHAKDLAPTDINGLADPYCILKLIPSRFEGTHLRSKTIHKSLNPVFNETLTFYGVSQHDLTWQTLQILVMDDDRWGKDCLGTTQIPLHRLRSQQTRCFVQTLERGRLSEEREWGRGRLLLSLTYMTEKSLLLVGVIQAQDLPALDHNGTSDPFVKVRLLHDTNLGALSSSCLSSSSINRKYRTSVKWRTLNPEFREEFSLKVSIVDLPRLALVISVWDKDLGKNDDYIGGIVLSTGSKGERLKHWLDMMKLPNTKHFKWHTISPSVLPNH